MLVASILDSTDHHDRPAPKETLRQSPAREQATHLVAERERNLLEVVLAQPPVAIGIFRVTTR